MPKTKKLYTNFSKGEYSDLIEGRPDLAAYYNGARKLENVWLYPEGGAFRRPGTRMMVETKDSAAAIDKKAMLIPFEFNVEQAYMLEYGNLYARFFKNGARIENPPGTPVQVVTPYGDTELKDIHYRQSADVLFKTHPSYEVRKLSRVSDTSWTASLFNADPPPSFEADTNLATSGGPAANTGTGVKFRVGVDSFLAGDVGRQIIAGAGRGVITAFTNVREVTMDILDAFAATIAAGPNTLSSTGTTVTSTAHGAAVGNLVSLTSGAQSGEIRSIVSITDADTFEVDTAFSVAQSGVTWNKIVGFASGAWVLRLSPQSWLDPDKKEPVGSQVTLVARATSGGAAQNTFRSSDVGKFIKVYGGLIKLTIFDSASQMKGTILSILEEATTADPTNAPPGAWSLEDASWSDARGWPQSIEFHQGRLALGGTATQKTTLWLSSSISLSNFAVGSLATNALQYTLAARRVNIIEWLASLGQLFIGDAENEHIAKGQGVDAPLGGDEIPYIRDQSAVGSQHVQPVVVQSAIIFLQRFKRKVFELSYALESDSFSPKNRTLLSRQIGNGKFAQHAPAYASEPNSIVYFVMENGELGCLTINREEDVTAWSRVVTDGTIESVAVIPHPDGDRHQVGIIVKRMINGEIKRFVEYFEDGASEMSGRLWPELHTDCAKVGTILAGATQITGLSHLEGKTVDVIIGNDYIGQLTVTAGIVTIPAAQVPGADTTYEVGLHYDSTIQTARVAIPNEVTEGLKRHWISAVVRLKDSIGGKINGERLTAPATKLFNGIKEVLPTDWDFEGRLEIVQDQPYPFQVLNIAGEVEFADQFGGVDVAA